MEYLNGTSKHYISGNKLTIFLNKQENYKCLKDEINLNPLLYQQDSDMIKQRSETWHQLRNESRITGSTFFRALGLDILKEQQLHYDKVYRGLEKLYLNIYPRCSNTAPHKKSMR